MDDLFETAVSLIRTERTRQLQKWGKQFHDLPVWGLILGEEVGEVCEAVLNARYYDPETTGYAMKILSVRDELVQVAAVAVAMIEAIMEGTTQPGEFVAGSHTFPTDGTKG